jgi:peptide/nickel transport system substrate-binding protein
MLDPIVNGRNIVQSNNVNTAEIDVPELNAALDKATQETDPAKRAAAYGEIDRRVTEGAYYVVWLWDNQINFTSKNVKGVRNKFSSSWDLSFSSLK